MLRVAVSYRKVNYNRDELFVYHLTDNITGKPIPICGIDAYDLTDEDEVDWLLQRIRERRNPIIDYERSRICERCRTIYLSPGEEEEKSKRRLARWKRKEARRKLIENYEQKVIENWLGHCPKCQSKVAIKEPRGYASCEARCESCNLEWTFSISAQLSGSFVIWAYDETERYNGKAKGHIKLKEINWEWK